MLGKTHVAVGIASALLLMPITNINDCVMALMGGTIGGVIADIDTWSDDSIRTVTKEEFTGISIAVAILAVDFFRNGGICSYILEHQTTVVMGFAGILLFLIVGYLTAHRSFTHSILAMFLFSKCSGMIYPGLGWSCAIAYSSHLFLDVLNKKKLQLLFPIRRGICLKLCHADGFANTVFQYAGMFLSGVLLIYRIAFLFFTHQLV